MVENVDAQVYSLDDGDSEGEDSAVQDGGAGALLGSRHQVKKYIKYLVEKGVDMAEVEVYPCTKGFRCGNSQLEETKTCVVVPTYMGRNARCWSTSLVEQPPSWLDAPC